MKVCADLATGGGRTQHRSLNWQQCLMGNGEEMKQASGETEKTARGARASRSPTAANRRKRRITPPTWKLFGGRFWTGAGNVSLVSGRTEGLLDWAARPRPSPLVLFTGGVKLGMRLCPLTCGRSHDVPGGGLRHGVGQSLPEALVAGVCRPNVVPGNAEAFRPASVHFQQGHAAPIKRTCAQTGSHHL